MYCACKSISQDGVWKTLFSANNLLRQEYYILHTFRKIDNTFQLTTESVEVFLL